MLNQLAEYLALGGLKLTDSQGAQLARYHAMLIDWNSRMDLTNVPAEEMALRHYADSLLPLMQASWFPQGNSLIDVGSGAGFPGLPLAILRPDLQICLLDSLRKRCDFLSAVVSELQLHHVQVLHARAEDAARSALRERFELAVARALAPLQVLAEYLLPFVKPGGKALCWKGPSLAEELALSGRALKLLGAQAGECLLLPLPGLQHYVQALDKRVSTPKQYPRKAGTPARRPL